MTTQTKQSLVLSNTATIIDDEETVSEIKYDASIVNLLEYQRTKETIGISTLYTLDFGDIIPNYIKIVTTGDAEITLQTATMSSARYLEIEGILPALITVENLSTTHTIDVDIIIAQRQ